MNRAQYEKAIACIRQINLAKWYVWEFDGERPTETTLETLESFRNEMIAGTDADNLTDSIEAINPLTDSSFKRYSYNCKKACNLLIMYSTDICQGYTDGRREWKDIDL